MQRVPRDRVSYPSLQRELGASLDAQRREETEGVHFIEKVTSPVFDWQFDFKNSYFDSPPSIVLPKIVIHQIFQMVFLPYRIILHASVASLSTDLEEN